MDISDVHYENGKLMHKFNQNQLPTIFKNLFRPNNTVHSHSTRNRYAYHLPFYSTSVSQESIQYSGAKVRNALPSDSRALQSRSAFVTKLIKASISMSLRFLSSLQLPTDHSIDKLVNA